MGPNVGEMIIYFEQPVIVTQRTDEMLLDSDLYHMHPDMDFPSGPFGYTQSTENIMSFNRPMKLVSIYLKQHRSPNFYLKTSSAMFWMQAFFQGEMVLDVVF